MTLEPYNSILGLPAAKSRAVSMSVSVINIYSMWINNSTILVQFVSDAFYTLIKL